MPELDHEELHSALGDPILGSIGFLNEVMARYPDAISFAPGAPHPAFLREVETSRYVQRYLEHLRVHRGLGVERARLLLSEYGPSRGLINDLLAQALRLDEGITVAPEAMVVTVGAQEAMLLVLRALRRDSDDVLGVIAPSFAGVLGAARLLDMGSSRSTRPMAPSTAAACVLRAGPPAAEAGGCARCTSRPPSPTRRGPYSTGPRGNSCSPTTSQHCAGAWPREVRPLPAQSGAAPPGARPDRGPRRRTAGRSVLESSRRRLLRTAAPSGPRRRRAPGSIRIKYGVLWTPMS